MDPKIEVPFGRSSASPLAWPRTTFQKLPKSHKRGSFIINKIYELLKKKFVCVMGQ